MGTVSVPGSHRAPGESQRRCCSGGTGDTAQPQFAVERRWISLCLVAAANLVLHQTVERIHVGKKYGDIPRGIFVVRGENVVLLGEIVSARLPLQSGPGLGGCGLSVCLSAVTCGCCCGLESEPPPGPVQAEPAQKCQPAGQGCLLLPQPLWDDTRTKNNAEGAVGKLQACVALLEAVTAGCLLPPCGHHLGWAQEELSAVCFGVPRSRLPGLCWGSLPTSPALRALPAPLFSVSPTVRCRVGTGVQRSRFAVRAEGSFLLQDLEKESDTPLQQVSIEEILEEQRVEQQAKQESEKLKVQALKERGLSVPRADTLDEY